MRSNIHANNNISNYDNNFDDDNINMVQAHFLEPPQLEKNCTAEYPFKLRKNIFQNLVSKSKNDTNNKLRNPTAGRNTPSAIWWLLGSLLVSCPTFTNRRKSWREHIIWTSLTSPNKGMTCSSVPHVEGFTSKSVSIHVLCPSYYTGQVLPMRTEPSHFIVLVTEPLSSVKQTQPCTETVAMFVP
jgi:hypothetical protein